MSGRRWLALSVALHAVDRPRLDAVLADWATLGLVETHAAETDIEQITAHFSTDALSAATLESRCRQAFTSPPFTQPPQWSVEEQPDRDWTAPAREFFTGVAVGESLSVLPPWAPEDHPLAAAPITLRIDPGMAFGTGSHESTRLALSWLVDLLGPSIPGEFAALDPRPSFLDLGAGSAILAIAAARLGAGAIDAVEIDPEAEDNARRNLALNAVSHLVNWRIADFSRADLAPADLVVCNTLIEVFEPHLARLRDLTRPGGHLVLAGFLEADEAALAEGLRAIGLGEFTLRREAEWSSACVHRR